MSKTFGWLSITFRMGKTIAENEEKCIPGNEQFRNTLAGTTWDNEETH